MKQLTLYFLSLLILSASVTGHAFDKVTYIHSNGQGQPSAATDRHGDLEWKAEYYPFGQKYSDTGNNRKNDIGFANKSLDSDIGLSYFGARHYDPSIGRFLSVDPVPVQAGDYRTFNRYSYAFNNPYKYVDPDGNFAFLIPVIAFVGKEIAAEAASQLTGGLSDYLSVRKLGTKAVKAAGKRLVKKTCCFVAGTQVLTETGYKNIEDVELGERLWAKDVATGAQDWKPVTHIFEEADRGIFEVKLMGIDGFEQKIEATDDHPFYVVDKGWRTTLELVTGDLIETDGEGPMEVKSVIDEQRQDLTYNFTIADFHTYYVTKKNVLVHNCPEAKSAADRATEIHKAVPAATQSRTTIAVTETKEGIRVVSSSEKRLRPAQRNLLGKNEVEGVGLGHAEVTGVGHARGAGLSPTGTAASRPICSGCQGFLKGEGVKPLSPLKK